MQEAAAGKAFVDGAFITFIRTLLANPEALIWEKFWLERNKDLDRELYGLVKWCKPGLPFGLNVWNRNHFNIFRRAQWPWEEQTLYADWVKPITYQHQAGEVFAKELRLLPARPSCATSRRTRPRRCCTASWASRRRPTPSVVAAGMDPDTYVFGQCADAVGA